MSNSVLSYLNPTWLSTQNNNSDTYATVSYLIRHPVLPSNYVNCNSPRKNARQYVAAMLTMAHF